MLFFGLFVAVRVLHHRICCEFSHVVTHVDFLTSFWFSAALFSQSRAELFLRFKIVYMIDFLFVPMECVVEERGYFVGARSHFLVSCARVMSVYSFLLSVAGMGENRPCCLHFVLIRVSECIVVIACLVVSKGWYFLTMSWRRFVSCCIKRWSMHYMLLLLVRINTNSLSLCIVICVGAFHAVAVLVGAVVPMEYDDTTMNPWVSCFSP